MKISEAGFRAVYNQFTVFDLQGPFKVLKDDYSPEGDYNCALVWGYNDESKGLMLEVMAFGIEREDSMYFFDDPDISRRDTVAAETAEDIQFKILDDSEKQLMNRYEEKVKNLKEYYENQDLVNLRKDFRIDHLRDDYNPDIVSVMLITDYVQAERCKVKMDRLGDQVLLGTLLEQPKGNFSVKRGDQISFLLYSQQDDSWVLASDMSTGRPLEEGDTLDGRLLKQAISSFNQEKNQDNLVWVLNIISKSRLYMPATCGRHGLIGAGKDLYIPAFTAEDDMGIPDEMVNTERLSAVEIIETAENSEKRIKGIVINPFTEGFLLHKDLFQAIKEMA